MRSVVYRFDDLAAFARALRAADRELAVPGDEPVGDGEWVLSIFEIGKRATAAAARGYERAPGRRILAFELRDWERLRAFSEPVPVPSGSGAGAPSSTDLGAKGRTSSPAPLTDREAEAPATVRDSVVVLSKSGHHAEAAARVLLVDDDRATCEVVSAMLEAVGLLVVTVSSAEEALEKARTLAFQLVVLDWNLPGMSGLELCKRIRHEPELETLPLLFLTANTSQKDLVDAFASGADDYVLKPFRAPELGARIFGLLRRARMTRAATG